nr:hypothetical protein [Tanacetum cinerariifolium]
YYNQVINSTVFDSDEMFSSESDVRKFIPPKPDLFFHDAPTVNETVPTAFNVKPSPTGKFMPPKPDLFFHDAPTVNETVPTAFNVKPSPTKPDIDLPTKTVVTKPPLPLRKTINHSPGPKPSNFPQKVTTIKTPQVNDVKGVKGKWGNPHYALKDKGVIDSGCSRHMIENMSYLFDFEEINGGYVAFGGNPKGGKITGKGKIRTGKLDFDDVYFVKELKFNLFSVSQMVPRENNMYNVDLKNIVPSRDLTCLFAKETLDESNLWHKRLGHINFKTMNKLVKASKDETSTILKTFITGIKNQINLTVKIIISDNGTEFKNQDLNQFCGMKGIKREFSVARTPQQNGVVERKNRTLIEAARTMLADSLLPIPFWAETVNTSCYV